MYFFHVLSWYALRGTPTRFCFWPQSYVTTRFMLCFSAWQCAFMCIFLHGWGGWGGGGGLIAFCRLLPVASSFRHAPDATLYRSSLAILDTLPMLRSIDLLVQSSTRSRCYALKTFSCNPRHAHDPTLFRSSRAILDTLPMLRSIDLLLQSSTRSRCYAL